jgi:hypothetical protein
MHTRRRMASSVIPNGLLCCAQLSPIFGGFKHLPAPSCQLTRDLLEHLSNIYIRTRIIAAFPSTGVDAALAAPTAPPPPVQCSTTLHAFARTAADALAALLEDQLAMLPFPEYGCVLLALNVDVDDATTFGSPTRHLHMLGTFMTCQSIVAVITLSTCDRGRVHVWTHIEYVLHGYTCRLR